MVAGMKTKEPRAIQGSLRTCVVHTRYRSGLRLTEGASSAILSDDETAEKRGKGKDGNEEIHLNHGDTFSLDSGRHQSQMPSYCGGTKSLEQRSCCDLSIIKAYG